MPRSAISIAILSLSTLFSAAASTTSCPADGVCYDGGDPPWEEHQESLVALMQTNLHLAEVPDTALHKDETASNSVVQHQVLGQTKKARDMPTDATLKDDNKWKLDINLFLALGFVGLCASAPLVVVKFGGEQLSGAWYALSGALFMWLSLSIYLFTCVLPFSSGHFVEETRTLTLPEVTYFMSQVVTTVGYGDVVPATDLGKMIVACYILTAVFVIASMLTKVNAIVHERLVEQEDELAAADASRLLAVTIQEPAQVVSWEALLLQKKRRLVRCVLIFSAVVAAGVSFFTLYPGEEKPLHLAIYMSVITLSTVGFGVITPNTEVGMMFDAYWMVIGSFCLGACVEALAEVLLIMKDKEAAEPGESTRVIIDDLENVSTDVKGRLDMAAFLKFTLKHSGAVTEEQILALENQFAELGGDKDGKLAVDNIKARLKLKAHGDLDAALDGSRHLNSPK